MWRNGEEQEEIRKFDLLLLLMHLQVNNWILWIQRSSLILPFAMDFENLNRIELNHSFISLNVFIASTLSLVSNMRCDIKLWSLIYSQRRRLSGLCSIKRENNFRYFKCTCFACTCKMINTFRSKIWWIFMNSD